MNLYVNDLIEWNDGSIERVVWIDDEYSIAFLFELEANKGFPHPKSIAEIEEAITNKTASKHLQDPWARIVKDENLSERELSVRDKSWDIISSLISQEPDIYYRHLRGSLVKETVENYNRGKTEGKLVERTVYGYLRRYWQRGKIKNALIPDYINSAGKGTTRKSNGVKRGRPRKYGAVPEIGKGINITEEDRRIFSTAITKHYNNRKKNSLTTAYKLMLKEYYTEEMIFDDRGVKQSILIPPEKRPTLNQFRYWYNKEQRDIKKTISSRKGSRTFALEHRAILGRSKQEAIAREIDWLSHNYIEFQGMTWLRNKYKSLLIDRGSVTKYSRTKFKYHEELFTEAFVEFYGKEFLQAIQSQVWEKLNITEYLFRILFIFLRYCPNHRPHHSYSAN